LLLVWAKREAGPTHTGRIFKTNLKNSAKILLYKNNNYKTSAVMESPEITDFCFWPGVKLAPPTSAEIL